MAKLADLPFAVWPAAGAIALAGLAIANSRKQSLRYLPESERELDVKDLVSRASRILKELYKTPGPLLPPFAVAPNTFIDLHDLLAYYPLLSSVKITTRFEAKLDSPGTIRRCSETAYEILFDEKYRKSPDAYNAILAHELAHIWVDQCLPPNHDVQSLERDVDTAALLCGGAYLILHGIAYVSHVKVVGNMRYTSSGFRRFGYLSTAEAVLVSILALRNSLGIEKPRRTQMNRPVRIAWKLAARALEGVCQRIELTDGTAIARCYKCLGRLRVPFQPTRTLQLTCPTCRAAMEMIQASNKCRITAL